MRLWPTARAEVQRFVGFCLSWTRDWCSTMVATGASEYGIGVRLKSAKKLSAKVLDGPVNERDSVNAILAPLVNA